MYKQVDDFVEKEHIFPNNTNLSLTQESQSIKMGEMFSNDNKLVEGDNITVDESIVKSPDEQHKDEIPQLLTSEEISDCYEAVVEARDKLKYLKGYRFGISGSNLVFRFFIEPDTSDNDARNELSKLKEKIAQQFGQKFVKFLQISFTRNPTS